MRMATIGQMSGDGGPGISGNQEAELRRVLARAIAQIVLFGCQFGDILDHAQEGQLAALGGGDAARQGEDFFRQR